MTNPQHQALPHATRSGPSWLEHPILGLGFRPFYLLSAAFAALAIPVWLLRYYGKLPGAARVDLVWHTHEMVYGFAVAVLIGFLYTAARNWTGLWTPRHGHLAALALLWLAGRAAMLLLNAPLAAIVDLAFLPMAAWPLYRVLRRAGNKRNLFLVALLGLLALVNLAFHAARLGWIEISPLRPVHTAILIIVVIESAIGGRVIPMFTGNALPGVKPLVDARGDRIALALTIGAALAWTLSLPGPLCAGIAAAAAVAQATRLAGWMPHRTLAYPLLWILHASYAWIVVGLLLLALSALDVVSASAAFHALAVGSMAGLVIGMITRTALGHTGAALRAGAGETAMYALVQFGALARLAAAIGPVSWRDGALMLAALTWSLAFLLYLALYLPRLCAPRPDGKPG
ncbi:NnrS family protein [Noviherbaspirillum sp. DKR-6]|uniref:NnrS family protein n=2 Tax=Noviherbaspirillum pedocola TaxID=2801341 RepID=A0A934SXY2_9BURK|nr:NnrS family protein [Noviherbaspirillum pedocola]